MPPKPHEAAAAPESSHSCCVGKYGNTTVQVMHNARHRPLLQACARRPPVRFPARLFHRVPGPCVLFAGGMLICGLMWCGLHITRAMHLRLLGLPRCGRCRYWATVQCPLYGRNTPDDFCSRGERWGD